MLQEGRSIDLRDVHGIFFGVYEGDQFQQANEKKGPRIGTSIRGTVGISWERTNRPIKKSINR